MRLPHVGCVAEAEGAVAGGRGEGFGEFWGEDGGVIGGVWFRGGGDILLSNGISHAAMRAYSLISLCCSSSPWPREFISSPWNSSSSPVS